MSNQPMYGGYAGMGLGWPNRPQGSPTMSYQSKEEAWIVSLLEENRSLRERIERLEKRVEVLMPDKSDDI